MKHLYKMISGALLLAVCGMNATAQQLPNVGFDSDWVDCVPWTSNGNTKTKGTQPVSWTVSNVIGMSGTGATQVANQVDGYNGSAYAVELVNTANQFKSSEIVPAYMSLGTTWATSTGLLTVKNKDGGTFGGISFTYKPDAISFYYKRSHGTGNATEQATVVAYLWKGTWTQASVPGNNASSSATKVEMTDRERNILGMSTDQGGDVTKTDDAELIASLNYAITGDASDWTRFLQPLEYVSESTPAKFNVIIAANNYFSSTGMGAGNSITVDNVELIYYSRLSALSVNGTAVEGFASDVYSYTMSGTTLPTEEQIEATVMGRSAVKSVAIDSDAATVTITVTNSDVDVDGLKSHSYVLQYEKAPAKEGVDTNYDGYLNITMQEDPETLSTIAENDPATITITDYNDGTCDFLLPNLVLTTLEMELGDIKVENATVVKDGDGNATYSGTVEKMPLLDGGIIADVELSGTISAAGKVNMNINVMWILDETDRSADVPIYVTFTTDKVSGVNGVSVATSDIDAKVDVYTITGVKVMSGVAAADAVKSLDKGFYIMGNKKVVIR